MPEQLTNNTNIPLSMALWLMDDDYDHDPDPYTLSATTLLKPMKAIILSLQNPDRVVTLDILNKAASRLGTAMHDAIEKTWRKETSYIGRLLCKLGLPQLIAGKVIIDPTPKEIAGGCIPVYMEQRAYKQVGNYRISGKFDFIMNGKLEDYKSTGTYTYSKQTNDKKYAQQGSLYRWLNPKLITDPIMTICFFFTDWKAGQSYEQNYPANKVMGVNFVLDSIENTQLFVERTVATIEKLLPVTNQSDLPPCTREDLWQGPGVWKYYAKPDAKRATKNFDNPAEAQARLITDGNIGHIIHFPDEAKACVYCDVNTICEQGILNLTKPIN